MTVFLVPNVYVFQMAPDALLLFSSIIVWIRPQQRFCYYLQHNGSTSIVVMLFISHTFRPTLLFISLVFFSLVSYSVRKRLEFQPNYWRSWSKAFPIHYMKAYGDWRCNSTRS
jgi:hypothetical protein